MENYVGKRLDGRYEIQDVIGVGGMAIVYKAKDILLNRLVAVKILREEFKENEDFIRRFNIESQASASLSHQNIAQIYDVGDEDGVHY
ncbi:MAG: serine/threonine protein kinase, partial [Clostridia bacterium]|nr:serine/threonine protein kinase [Clostridia bacterium]